MTTVAEGVETQAQLDYLIREGCDESQGYLHSRPVPKAEFERLLGFSGPMRGQTTLTADIPASRTRRA
jgi:EAL domain-containing protein (putative c-di-GMP-specific phosphodiesterase class I)